MSDLKGFWSYVHADDDTEKGRIRGLAADVKSQFEMLTGEQIELFLDKDDIEWGDNWRRKVDESLALIAFFIPVLTPRYFMSAECRRELHSFALKAANLGVKELLLPVLYADVPSLHDDETADELAALVKTFQWEDWRELRFADAESERYRRAVARLAERLVDANAKADKAEAAERSVWSGLPPYDALEEPDGMLDRLAAMEEAMPEWASTMEAIGADIVRIGELMSEATAGIERGDSQGKGFAARLAVARILAAQLREPSDGILAQSSRFASQLHEVDSGVRVIIENGPDEVLRNPDSRQDLCDFFRAVRQISLQADQALDSTQQMIDGISSLEAMSRDLRAPLRSIRQGLTTLVEGREVMDGWVRLIDAADVDCANLDETDSDGAPSTLTSARRPSPGSTPQS